MRCYPPLEEDELHAFHLELMFSQCSTKIVILCIQLALTKLLKTKPCLLRENLLEKKIFAIFVFGHVRVLGETQNPASLPPNHI